MGSSHGQSRITRATGTDVALCALAVRGMRAWADVEAAAGGERLYRRCGSLDLGDPRQPAFARLVAAARPPTEVLSPAEVRTRWPGAFGGLAPSWRGVFDPRGGVLHPNRAVP